MHSKKTGLAKTFSSYFKRFFRARSLIIISEHKVDHVPLSGMMQILIILGTLGLFSGISYITGSYVTARNTIRKEERRIASTTLEKVRIGEEMDVLKRDLTRLSQNGKELDTYSKFIVASNTGGAYGQAGSFFGQDNIGMSEKVSYLEEHIRNIQDENDHLVAAIRRRTDKKISDFEDIISMTGLDSDKLEKMAAAGNARPGTSPDELAEDSANEATPDTATAEDKSAAKKDARRGENEGGPFIPYDSNLLNDADRECRPHGAVA
jgi:hypothetical protein